MNPRRLIEIMDLAEKLKDATRHCYTSGGRHESVAEHSWRISLMAYFLTDVFPEADMDKVIKMCLIHDLGECFTGDIPTFLKTADHEEREEKMLSQWVCSLPAPYHEEMSSLFREMAERKTLEAKIWKALDGLEAVIQHNESDIHTWLPLEYDLNLTYATETVAFSEYLKELREEIKKDTMEKIQTERGFANPPQV